MSIHPSKPPRGSVIPTRLRRAAWAFTTRRVRGGVSGLVEEHFVPRAGDLVLAKVDAIGHHSVLQTPDGRRRHLFVGDEIVVAYGNRYAPNQIEAIVPKSLGPCQLVAGGGVAGKALSWHANLSKGPTQITPVGLVAGPNGEPVNIRDHALPDFDRLPHPLPTTIAVVGTAMDSGKTQTAAYLVNGLTNAGLRVGFAKVTGTGAGGDTGLLKDAGATPVLDFTDAGLVSTYLATPAEIERVFVTLMAHLTQANVDAIVLELADGILQGETSVLLGTSVLKEAVSGIVFTACDAMGAVAGHGWLQSRELPLIALGGVLTAAPLQRTEATQATGLPTFTRQDLGRATTAIGLLNMAERRRSDTSRNGGQMMEWRTRGGRSPRRETLVVKPGNGRAVKVEVNS